MASTSLLGKLLADYLSTSNDPLSVSFRRQYAPSPVQPVSRPTRVSKISKSSCKLTTATFTYCWRNRSAKSITQLYQCLLRAKWIASGTNPDDFLALFSGEESTARVKWTGKPSYLYYLIRRAVEQKLITIPTNGKIWQITESHFVDSSGRPLHDLRKQKDPKRAVPAIEAMLKILEPSA